MDEAVDFLANIAKQQNGWDDTDNIIENEVNMSEDYTRIGSADMEPAPYSETLKETFNAIANIFSKINVEDYSLGEFDTFEQVLIANFAFKFNTMIAKQKGYGPENISKAGLRGIITRTQDKLERAKTLIGDPENQVNRVKEAILDFDNAETQEELFEIVARIDSIVNPKSALSDESLVDTLGDLGNYGDIAVILHEGAWGKRMVS